MIRDPAAIIPLMGTAGWGKGSSESLKIQTDPFVDVLAIRLDGQDNERSHPSTNRNTRQRRTRETPPDVESGIQSNRYEAVRTNRTQESHTIIGGNRAAWPVRPG